MLLPSLWRILLAMALFALLVMVVSVLWLNNSPGFFGESLLGDFLAVLAIGICAAIYFVPSLVGHRYRHRNMPGLFILNLLLGWTFVGWVLALVWAALKQERSAPPRIE